MLAVIAFRSSLTYTLVAKKVEAFFIRCPWFPGHAAPSIIACTRLTAATAFVAFSTDEVCAFIATHTSTRYAFAYLSLGSHMSTSPIHWAPHHIDYAACSLATTQLVHEL